MSLRLTDRALEAARILYDFHFLRQTARAADVIVALGTNDLRVAEFAASLYHQGFGAWLVCTGGIVDDRDGVREPARHNFQTSAPGKVTPGNA